MRRVSLGSLVPALTVALALVVAGCGGDSGSEKGGSSGGGTAPGGAKVGEGKQGGAVTFLAAGDIDFLDPGQTYYTFGYMVQYAVNRPLYSFSPDNAEKPVPDLADGEPQISEDNKTITVKIRKGVKYAPPVNREVKAQDVKYAIERAFTSNVPSGYATSYFAEIDGAPASPVSIDKLKPFPGLETPDDNTLVIKLTKPVAQRVAAALVMPITIPVPEEYASKFDKKSPTDYDQYVAFTGPYMVKNDSSGKAVGRDPGKKIELVRNPNWDKSTDYRPAFLDSVTIEEGNDDLTVASRRTISGQKLMCCDSGQPPITILKRALTRYKDQLGRVASGGTRWIALNTTQKPFDNLNVRKAIIAGFDRNALRLTRGGETVGPIAQGYIPPGIPGHDESGGTEGFTDFDWMQNPKGDAEVAKKYMLAAKKEGVPVTSDGKYDGGEKILTIATNADPGLQTAQVAQTEFNKLGFKLNFRKVPQDTLYTKFCGIPKAKVAICPNVGWFKDFTDPESMLEPTFDGKAIKPAGNVNWSQLDDDAINKAMGEAALKEGDERYKAWADINKMIVAQAPGIPYSWDDSFQLESTDVQSVMDSYNTTWNLSFTSLK
jgi:peptide/nickel transport system substrate-binding protein